MKVRRALPQIKRCRGSRWGPWNMYPSAATRNYQSPWRTLGKLELLQPAWHQIDARVYTCVPCYSCDSLENLCRRDWRELIATLSARKSASRLSRVRGASRCLSRPAIISSNYEASQTAEVSFSTFTLYGYGGVVAGIFGAAAICSGCATVSLSRAISGLISQKIIRLFAKLGRLLGKVVSWKCAAKAKPASN